MSRSSRRGPWLPEEDATLLHLVRTQGPNNWVRISQHMQHRTPKQCRERYHQNLKPSLNHEPISAQEGEVIEQLVQEMGKRWAEIARRLGSRSDNAVKNWWNGSMNRRKRTTVQHGSRPKMGSRRTQPIPAAAPPPPSLRQHLYLQGKHASKTFPDPSPFHRHGISAASIFEQGHQPIARPQPPRDSVQTRILDVPLSFRRHDQPLTSPSPYSASRLLSPGSHLPARPQTWSPSRSEYQLPPINCSIPPAPSPVASELSHTSSNPPAPSLVSDNQSNYSISPKTVTSPRPGMTVSAVPSMESWPEVYHRSSTGRCLHAEVDGTASQRHEDDLRRYRLSGNREDAFHKVSLYSDLPRPLLPDSTITRLHQDAVEVCGYNEPAISPQQKDSRMTVSRLLE